MKKKIKIISGIILTTTLALISACTTTYNVEQDGRMTHFIDCTGLCTNINACFARAESICPAGYKVVFNTVIPNTTPMAYSPSEVGLPYAQRIPNTVKGIGVVCEPK